MIFAALVGGGMTLYKLGQANSPPAKNQDSVVTTEKSVVTRENFFKIKEGMPYLDVIYILGKGTVVQTTSQGGITVGEVLQWSSSSDGKAIIITFHHGKVWSKDQRGLYP